MTDETDWAVVTGVNNGGGSRIMLPSGGSEGQRFYASGASIRFPEDENGTTG